MFKALATLGYLLIAAGFLMRRRRRAHVPLVLAGMGIDLALVLILEFSRDVIGMTFSHEWTVPQWVHIGASVLATVLYLVVLPLGIQMLRGGSARVRRAHRGFAQAALALRTVGFVFMWAI